MVLADVVLADVVLADVVLVVVAFAFVVKLYDIPIYSKFSIFAVVSSVPELDTVSVSFFSIYSSYDCSKYEVTLL